MRLLSLLLLLLSMLPGGAEVRTWRNANGALSFEADYISSDGTRVTMKRSSDHRILTFALGKLHADDQAWVAAQTAPPEKGAKKKIPQGAAFGTLEFGDDRRTVEDKLKRSSMVIATVDESLFGRTGLNGVYKTRATIGGLHCHLYFDWTPSGLLREVTLQTQPTDQAKYSTLLKSNWNELIELLGKLHGNPVQQAPYPKREELQDGLLLGSHLWYTEDGHSAILCTGQERDKYLVAVRITSEHIVPTPIHSIAPPPSTGRGRVAPR